MKNKYTKNKLALISFILGLIYTIFLIYDVYIVKRPMTDDSYARTLLSIIFIIKPHMFFTIIALLFKCIGYFNNDRNFILAGAILYIIAIVLFVLFFWYLIIQVILSFIAFIKMPKKSTI